MGIEMRKKIGVEMGVDEGRDGVDWVDGGRNGGMGVETAIETRLMLATTTTTTTKTSSRIQRRSKRAKAN